MTPRDIARRLMSVESRLATIRRSRPPVPPYAHLSDVQLATMILDAEQRLAQLDALPPPERQRWEQEMDRAAAIPDDGMPDRIQRMSDDELEAAIIRTEAKWQELVAERGAAHA